MNGMANEAIMNGVSRVGVTPRELVLGVVELGSPPEIYTRLSALIDQGTATSEQIAEVIQRDPGLTIRLLKIVNSAFYGYPSEISTVGRAITLVGLRELKDLVLATTVMELFRGIPNELVDMQTFWQGSLRCAVLSKVIASYHQSPDKIDSIFTAGILHDIGHLIIFHKLPELARMALLEQIYQEREIQEVEQELWGFDYAAVGGELARLWKLPSALQETISLHIAPDKAVNFPTECSIVHISSRIARLAEQTVDNVSALIPSQSVVWKLAGMQMDLLPEVLEKAEEQYQETLRIFA